jgi:hypothetical protein
MPNRHSFSWHAYCWFWRLRRPRRRQVQIITYSSMHDPTGRASISKVFGLAEPLTTITTIVLVVVQSSMMQTTYAR